MRKKQKTFEAISLEPLPKYKINIDKNTVCQYNPLLMELAFAKEGKLFYPLSEMEKMERKEVKNLGVATGDFVRLIAFCKDLPLLNKDTLQSKGIHLNGIRKQISFRIKEAALNDKIKNRPELLLIKEKLSEPVKKIQREEKMEFEHWKHIQQKVENFCYTKLEKKLFTRPECRVRYDKKLGRNKFYICFNYTVNFILKPYVAELKKLNEIEDLEKRTKKAEALSVLTYRKLYRGTGPDIVFNWLMEYSPRKECTHN